MRLVAVSIVKNEADVIEVFIRHTSTWVDHHLIFDHDSTDGTREILEALRQEGVPITLYTDNALANLQQIRSNYLSRLAALSFGADWILPLDADEILVGPDRKSLEACLRESGSEYPYSLRLLNYYPTAEDNSSEMNPIHRLRYCQTVPSHTKKIMIPGPLVHTEHVTAGKGSHALYRGTKLIPDNPLPEDYCLAHLALRSPQHQVLRVVLAELQKLSQGKVTAGLDTHYRLGYQLLSENPDLFFASHLLSTDKLRLQPINYCGTETRYSSNASGWNRIARALLPYLEHLAKSHGQLLDGEKQISNLPIEIKELTPSRNSTQAALTINSKFTGFIPVEGWTEREGPVPEAYLPLFHWGIFPITRLFIESQAISATLIADVLTYSEGQSITVIFNGKPVHTHNFTRTNQKETLKVQVALSAGQNEVILRYTQKLVTEYDSRQLSVIYLSLRVLEP
jgi:glycosyltransferase involved in cell wall biosynthesis